MASDEGDRSDKRTEPTKGQVSEVSGMDPAKADEPVSDSQAIAGNPTSGNDPADEGPAGPNAKPDWGRQRNRKTNSTD